MGKTRSQEKKNAKSIFEANLIHNFEFFLSSYPDLLNKFPYHSMQQFEIPNIKSLGFINKWDNFYIQTKRKLTFWNLTDDEFVQQSQFKGKFNYFKQHIKNKSLFAFSNDDNISIYNKSTTEVLNFKVEGNKIKGIEWLPKENKLIAVLEDGNIEVIDIESQTCYQQYNEDDNTTSYSKILLSSHKTNQFLSVIFNDQLKLIDFRDKYIIKNYQISNDVTAIDWFPSDTFGCALGYNYGNVDLYSYSKGETLFSQKISDNPINKISFCGSLARNNAVGFSSGSSLYFSTLPDFGFGEFYVTQEYEQHLSDIVDFNWFVDGKNASIISCDKDSLVHLFGVPDEFTPIYQP